MTIAASAPRNLTLIVLENGIYEVTGGQTTAGARPESISPASPGPRALPTVLDFNELEPWRQAAAGLLRFPARGSWCCTSSPWAADYQLPAPGPIGTRIARFRESLQRGMTNPPAQ